MGLTKSRECNDEFYDFRRRRTLLAKQVAKDCGQPVLHAQELPKELVKDCHKFLRMMDAYERLKNNRGTEEGLSDGQVGKT